MAEKGKYDGRTLVGLMNALGYTTADNVTEVYASVERITVRRVDKGEDFLLVEDTYWLRPPARGVPLLRDLHGVRHVDHYPEEVDDGADV